MRATAAVLVDQYGPDVVQMEHYSPDLQRSGRHTVDQVVVDDSRRVQWRQIWSTTPSINANNAEFASSVREGGATVLASMTGGAPVTAAPRVCAPLCVVRPRSDVPDGRRRDPR